MTTERNRLLRKGFFIVALACWFGLSFFGTAQTNQALPSALLDEGVKLLGAGQFIQAVDLFNRFKQTAPQDARPYFYAGIALTEIGDLTAAALELNEAVRLDRQRPEYRVFQANVFARLKQNSHALDALGLFASTAKFKELETSWLLLLGEVYLRLEKPDDSLKTLEVAAERRPAADFRIDLNRGKAYLAKGEVDLALAAFKRSVEKSALNPVAYFELGKILQQRNEMAESKKALLEAVGQEPRNAEFLHKLALVCLGLDEPGEAIEYLKRAEPSAQTFPQVYYALGSAYQRTGDRVRAAAYRKKFQEVSGAQRRKDDQEREVVRLIAQGERQLDLKNEAEAQALFKQALKLDPKRWSAHGYLAEMLLASEDWRSAYPHLMRMEELDPNSTVGKYLLARYWYRSGEFEKARANAEQVKLSQPGHADLRNLLGNILQGLGRNEEAMQEYEAAVRLAPDRPEFQENLKKVSPRPNKP